MTKEERQKKQSAGCWLVICHSGFLRHSAFLLHRFRSGSLLSPGVEIPNRTSYNENMLHLIWYLFVGFLVGLSPRRSCICIYRSRGRSCSVLSARSSAVR